MDMMVSSKNGRLIHGVRKEGSELHSGDMRGVLHPMAICNKQPVYYIKQFIIELFIHKVILSCWFL